MKAGKRTYFFDVKKADNDEKYLALTESRLTGQDQGRERSQIIVLTEALADFVQALNDNARNI